MAFEKRWPTVSPNPLVIDGTAEGLLGVADSRPFYVKQLVVLSSSTQPAIEFQVNRIVGNLITVGPKGSNIHSTSDISGYLVSDGASISVPREQPRPAISPDDVIRAIFEEEPTVALRSMLVDEYGDSLGQDSDNPIHVQLSDGSVNIGTVNAELEVQLSHEDDSPNPGDVHDSVRIGDGEKEVTATDYGSGKNVIDTAPLELSVARGKFPGFRTVNLYGRNLEVDVANEEEVNPLGATLLPTTAAQVSVVSTSTSDAAAGSGAREVLIEGLDSNYDEISETVAMNGTTTVLTVASFLRVNSVRVTSVGGSGANVGIIIGFRGFLEFLFAIQEEDNKHLSTTYTVPNGKTARLTSLFASVVPSSSAVGVKEGEVCLHSTSGDDGIFARRASFGISSRATAPFTMNVHETFEERSDIKVLFDTNSNNSRVTAGYGLILEDN